MTKEPRISANKIAEYCTEASPNRRRTIIRTIKNQDGFFAHYVDAKQIIESILTDGMTNAQALAEAAALESSLVGTKHEQGDKKRSAEVIRRFLQLKDELDLKSGKIKKADQFSTNSMEISGVRLTVRVDYTVHDSNDTIIGGIIIHYGKTNPLSEKGCELAATVIRQFLENTAPETQIQRKFCLSMDIHNGLLIAAPAAFKNRMKEIDAACEEIFTHWEAA